MPSTQPDNAWLNRAIRKTLPCLAAGLARAAAAESANAFADANGDRLDQAAKRLLYRLVFAMQIEARKLTCDAHTTTLPELARGAAIASANDCHRKTLSRHLDDILAHAHAHVVSPTGPVFGEGDQRDAGTHAAVPPLHQCRVDDTTLAHAVTALVAEDRAWPPAAWPDGLLGRLHEHAMAVRLVVQPPDATDIRIGLRRHRRSRKASGSFYTPDAIVQQVIDRALQPAVDRHLSTLQKPSANAHTPKHLEAALRLTVLDPAMGTGHFLLPAVDCIAARIIHWLGASTGLTEPVVRRMVAQRCIFGVDSDAVAAELARACLSLTVAQPGSPALDVHDHLIWGDALTGPDVHIDNLAPPVDWPNFACRTGTNQPTTPFDVVIGNPPWVSLSGRQRQHVDTRLLDAWTNAYRSFDGWRSVHGVFLEQATRLTRPGGMIGLVLPARVCDLDGYRPLRHVVTQHCEVAGPVQVIGEDGFAGVTEPAGIFVLRRRMHAANGSDHPWPNRQTNGTRRANRPTSLPSPVVRKIDRFDPLPANAFGDPGVHTGNSAKLLIQDEPTGQACAAIREGRQISRYHADQPQRWLRLGLTPTDGQYWRITPTETWRRTRLLLRQTADRPIAAPHDQPTYFRNSVLACYGVDGLADGYLLAVLNSTLVACLHRTTFGDATQRSFPQVKVSHLRRIPIPQRPMQPLSPGQRRQLTAWANAQTDQAQLGQLAEPPQIGEDATASLQHALAHLAEAMCGLARRQRAWQHDDGVSETRRERLADQIERLDRVIDLAVYRLYGLTDSQIRQVDRLSEMLTR